MKVTVVVTTAGTVDGINNPKGCRNAAQMVDRGRNITPILSSINVADLVERDTCKLQHICV